MLLLFLMIRRTPRSTRTYTRFPYTTRFRSTYASPDTIPSSGSLRRMARGPVAVGIPGWTTALAGTEGTRVQGESEYRCTMGRQAARRPQSTGTRPAADAGRLESTIPSTPRQTGRAHV